MKTFRFALCVVFIAVSLGISGQNSTITGIRAMMFYNEDKELGETGIAGSFSPDLIEDSAMVLWNVPIGGGSALGYANQTLIMVEVSSTGLSNVEQLLRLTVSSGGKTLSTMNREFSCIGDPARYQLLFLFDDHCCEPLELKAELIRGGNPASALTKILEYHCGE